MADAAQEQTIGMLLSQSHAELQRKKRELVASIVAELKSHIKREPHAKKYGVSRLTGSSAIASELAGTPQSYWLRTFDIPFAVHMNEEHSDVAYVITKAQGQTLTVIIERAP